METASTKIFSLVLYQDLKKNAAEYFVLKVMFENVVFTKGICYFCLPSVKITHTCRPLGIIE